MAARWPPLQARPRLRMRCFRSVQSSLHLLAFRHALLGILVFTLEHPGLHFRARDPAPPFDGDWLCGVL